MTLEGLAGPMQCKHTDAQMNPTLPRLLTLSAVLILSLPARAAQLYVATTGNDANPGTRSRPFATLEHARDEVRHLRQDDKPSRVPLTIWLRGGD